MANEAQDIYAKLADVCSLNPRVSMKILKMHGLFTKDVLEFLFFEAGLILLDEAICVAYDTAEKKKFWRRAKIAMCANGYYRVSDIIKIPQQYYEILQKRDFYLSIDDAMVILGIPKRTLYAIIARLGIKRYSKSSIDFCAFKSISTYLANGIQIKDAASELGISIPRIYAIMNELGIAATQKGFISWSGWEALKSKRSKSVNSCKNNPK